LVGRGEAHFVAVALDPDDDVAMETLLQIVAEWAGEAGLRFVNFHVGDQMSMVLAQPAENDSPDI
jgi:hypothetical protein